MQRGGQCLLYITAAHAAGVALSARHREGVVNRMGRVLSIVAIMMLGLAASSWSSTATRAQEASPAAGDTTEEMGSFDPVGFAQGVALPDPADIFVVRLGLGPGESFPLEASDPSAGMLVVESGAFTFKADAPLTVTRGAGLLEALMAAEESGDMSSVNEMVAAGQEVTVEAGDTVFVPGSIEGEVRNDGQERAVGLVFLVGPPEAMMAEGTPAP